MAISGWKIRANGGTDGTRIIDAGDVLTYDVAVEAGENYTFQLASYDTDEDLQSAWGGPVPYVTSGGSSAGAATYDVSSLATDGTGTYADPWTGWVAPLEALFGPDMTFYFPSGVYLHTSTLVLGQHYNVQYKGEVGTILKYTGSDRCVEFEPTIDVGTEGIRVFGNLFENFIIDGNGTATDGLYVNETHSSVFRNLYVRSVTNARFSFHYTIANLYESIHASPRVRGADPMDEEITNAAYGLYVTAPGGPYTHQANVYVQFIADLNEGYGMYLDGTVQYNQFIGGQIDGCTGVGLQVHGTGNSFSSFDVEGSGNTESEDIRVFGSYNRFENCVVRSRVKIGQYDSVKIRHTEIVGCNIGSIHVDANAEYTLLDNVAYGGFPYTGVPTLLVDNSATTVIVGPPFHLANEAADPVAANFPGHGIFKGDVEHLNTFGPIIRSPDGTRYRIKVANGGALSTEVATSDLGLAQSDDFSALRLQWHLDSMLLNYPTEDDVTVAVTGGQLSITLPNSTTGIKAAGYGNGAHELIDGGYEYVRLISKPTTGPYQIRFAIGHHKNANLNFMYDGAANTLAFNDALSLIATIAFNAVTMQYWRFRRSGANVVAEYSQDASSWTTLGTSSGIQWTDFDTTRACIEGVSTGSATFSAPIVLDSYVYFRG